MLHTIEFIPFNPPNLSQAGTSSLLELHLSTGQLSESFFLRLKSFQSRGAFHLVLLGPIFLLEAMIYTIMIVAGPFLVAISTTGAVIW